MAVCKLLEGRIKLSLLKNNDDDLSIDWQNSTITTARAGSRLTRTPWGGGWIRAFVATQIIHLITTLDSSPL